MKIKLIAVAVVTALLTSLSFVSVEHFKAMKRRASRTEVAERELAYHKEAEKINEYYAKNKVMTRTFVIASTLKAVDKYLPKYFPNGPYTRRDLIAVAMVESSFDQYLVGSHKEYGIFQIMPESAEWAGVKYNQFDVDINTEMALFVLQKKYESTKDYKVAIIAYNGLVKKQGKLSETYWKKFTKARNAVDDILGDNNIPQ